LSYPRNRDRRRYCRRDVINIDVLTMLFLKAWGFERAAEDLIGLDVYPDGIRYHENAGCLRIIADRMEHGEQKWVSQ
jgi:hypothetical protein